MAAEPPPAIDLAITVEDAAWTEVLADAEARVETAVRAAVAGARGDGAGAVFAAAAYELGVVLSDDARVRALNRDWRGRDEPTNVLAFEAGEAPPAGAPWQLGDVVVAFATTRAEAKAGGRVLADHLAHLVVHGVLHLFGYDHGTDAEAERMETLETGILSGLDVADPYGRAGVRA